MLKKKSTKQSQRYYARQHKYFSYHHFYVDMEKNDRWDLHWHDSNPYDEETWLKEQLEEERKRDELEAEYERQREKEQRWLEEQGCMDCGKGGKGDIPCRCPPRRNPYFDDDNWYERDHDSWESLRDKD